MQDLTFSSPAKRAAFLANIAKHQAKIRARLAQKVVPPAHVNGAVACDDLSAPGASVGHPLITAFHVVGPMGQIEHESPFDGHSWPPVRDGFWSDTSDCMDAPLWLPMGCASRACSGSRFPRDYGRMVRREPHAMAG